MCVRLIQNSSERSGLILVHFSTWVIMAAAAERFLLTGGGGFIGSWVVKNLIRRGAAVASLDIDVRTILEFAVFNSSCRKMTAS